MNLTQMTIPYIDYGDMPTQNMGRWPETSFYLLSQSDLIGLNLMELELMRNEIYARHGYKFETGSRSAVPAHGGEEQGIP